MIPYIEVMGNFIDLSQVVVVSEIKTYIDADRPCFELCTAMGGKRIAVSDYFGERNSYHDFGESAALRSDIPIAELREKIIEIIKNKK